MKRFRPHEPKEHMVAANAYGFGNYENNGVGKGGARGESMGKKSEPGKDQAVRMVNPASGTLSNNNNNKLGRVSLVSVD